MHSVLYAAHMCIIELRYKTNNRNGIYSYPGPAPCVFLRMDFLKFVSVFFQGQIIAKICLQFITNLYTFIWRDHITYGWYSCIWSTMLCRRGKVFIRLSNRYNMIIYTKSQSVRYLPNLRIKCEGISIRRKKTRRAILIFVMNTYQWNILHKSYLEYSIISTIHIVYLEY